MAAIERLSVGQQVARVALDLGYASPSAFAVAFRRVLGETPSQYLEPRSAPVAESRKQRRLLPTVATRHRTDKSLVT